MTPEHFNEQIAFLSQHRTPMPMCELVERLRSQTLPADAVAVTFDDGYRDNLVNAKPVLLAHRVPAILFLATGYVDSNAPFWWDELASMILACTRPVRQPVMCAGKTMTLHWGKIEVLDTAGTWRASDGPKTERQRCFLELWRGLQRSTVEERVRVMQSLRRSFEAPLEPLALPMTIDQVHTFLQDDALKIAPHTVTHPALTELSRQESRLEIEESLRICNTWSNKPDRGFAYPYGDMNRQVRGDVEAAGLLWACSTRGAFLDSQSADLYALPRVAVPDVPLRAFRALISS